MEWRGPGYRTMFNTMRAGATSLSSFAYHIDDRPGCLGKGFVVIDRVSPIPGHVVGSGGARQPDTNR